MTRRIQVNLIVFALLGLVLSAWALRNVLGVDAFSRPYRITAQFTSSPGLQPGFDVTYLGVAIGKIRSVRLDGKVVTVDLAIDKGRRIPEGVTAAASLKSAIGEPYVALEPGPGQAAATPMRPGSVIPVARTSVPESYGDLFAAVNRALNGLDPKNLRILSRELALGLDGRGDSLRLTVDGASRLAGTFARDTATLDGLITNLNALTRVLADHRGALGTGISSTADLTASLAEVDDSLASIRDHAPDLAARSARILRQSQPAAQCMVTSLGTALPAALSHANVTALAEGLRWAPPMAAAMNGVLTYVNGDPNLNLKFLLTFTPVKTAVEFRNVKPLPEIPPIPTCPGVTLPKQQIPPMGKKDLAERAKGTGTAQTPAPATDVSAHSTAGDSRHDPLAWLVYLPPLIATLILIAVAVRAFGPAWRLKRRSK
ncbi:MCE family protein [Actinomadura barringtoniae]|uniref:MCE family protein n=1 Tax=Actinomadura barringtoniae TaxID=1427535 RepID=A0A939T1I5_9ACTN|nr:MlaD family protein [Actinomadura barringtoniae]MBO2447681.1 MCE family protein [Actinomadura barringtoniae]